MEKKKVLVSVIGRFHAFDLAYQLQKRDYLYLLNTTFPKFVAKKWGIDKDRIFTNVHLAILSRYVKKYLPQSFNNKIANFVYQNQAKSNIRKLKNVAVFIGWSGSSLEAIIEAKKHNVVTILERGSSHYTHQMKILIEENKKFNIDFQPNYDTWKRELLEYELADYISIPSTYVKKTFIENGILENKLFVNPYGVDLSSFKQIEKKDNVFRVIFVGNLSVRKGSYYLIKAFHELNLQNSQLIHIGAISEEIEPIIQNFKNKKMSFLGHQPQNELYKYYSQGSVFVLTSLEEGMAMVQLQAMACGLPLICTTNTGGEDLISKDGEEGFVIPIRDENVLKEKLTFLYNNPEIAKQMGNKAKVKVSSGYTWDDYGDRYIDFLKKI